MHMAAIHLIKYDPHLPQIVPVQPGSDEYRSGSWAIAQETAHALVGERIFFHERQSAPSFFGGVVTGIELVDHGERAGRIIFIFKRDPTCAGVTTAREGWSQEMKIVL